MQILEEYLFFPQHFENFRMFHFSFFNKNETTMKTKEEEKQRRRLYLVTRKNMVLN